MKLSERLRRLSPELDMLACEDVLQAADLLEECGRVVEGALFLKGKHRDLEALLAKLRAQEKADEAK